MGPDPHVIGIIPRDCSQYRGPLYTIPDHNQEEHPRYMHDDLWRFKYITEKFNQFESTLEFLHDLSLTTKVHRFHKTSHLFFQYQEDI